jgi:hypothetical protein
VNLEFLIRLVPKKMYEWKITRLRAKAKFVGCVEAADGEAATDAEAIALSMVRFTPKDLRRRESPVPPGQRRAMSQCYTPPADASVPEGNASIHPRKHLEVGFSR